MQQIKHSFFILFCCCSVFYNIFYTPLVNYYFPNTKLAPPSMPYQMPLIAVQKDFGSWRPALKIAVGSPGRRDALFLEKSLRHSKTQRLHLPSMEGQRAIWTRNNNHWPRAMLRCVLLPCPASVFFWREWHRSALFQSCSLPWCFCPCGSSMETVQKK